MAYDRILADINKLAETHGLRSIASTTLHESGFDSLHIEACLSHSDENETRASYNRTDFFENRKPIMNWWSDHIEQALALII